MHDSPFIDEKRTLGRWMKEHQSGLYLTIIFHLIILIAMTIQGIHGQVNNQSVYVFDFSRQEAEEARKEEEIKKEEVRKEIEQEVDEMIRQALGAQETPRNVAVNTADLKPPDVKSTLGESKSLFDEQKALQERLDASRQKIEDMQGSDEVPLAGDGEEDKKENVQTYQGPSVLSFTLDGRKAVSLPVPVYKCQGGGDVTVTIYVNRQGYVVDASIQKKVSSNNDCLHSAALSAAKRSRFNTDARATEKQEGVIVYRFIAQ